MSTYESKKSALGASTAIVDFADFSALPFAYVFPGVTKEEFVVAVTQQFDLKIGEKSYLLHVAGENNNLRKELEELRCLKRLILAICSK